VGERYAAKRERRKDIFPGKRLCVREGDCENERKRKENPKPER